VAIVLGALVLNDTGRLSDVLQDRLDTAIELFQKGKVKCLLLTGDHGQEGYDEVNSMRCYAQDKGIPKEALFLDHAGFSTFASMRRARDVFQVKKAIVVTNGFHLDRALFLAQAHGIDCFGVVADRRAYVDSGYNDQREFLARLKAWFSVYFWAPQVLGGEPIPIDGPASASQDK